MHNFRTIRELAAKHPAGEMVFNKNINRTKVMIHKVAGGFVAYVDGDRLDQYKTQKEAEQMVIAFAKELK